VDVDETAVTDISEVPAAGLVGSTGEGASAAATGAGGGAGAAAAAVGDDRVEYEVEVLGIIPGEAGVE
jgi:hypothetical protein